MLGDDISQQLEYQAQQTFRADDPSLTADTDAQPIFLKSELSWKFDKNTRINNLVVSNNVFILHLNEKTIQRRCLDETSGNSSIGSSYQDVQMPDPINKIFLDPYGRLVIVSVRDKRDVYVLVSSTKSLKLIKKPIRFPNNTTFVLASVSWCNRFLQQQQPQNEVVALLAGQDGTIFEVVIRSDGEITFCNEVYPAFKTIVSSPRDMVTGIYCDVKCAYEDNSNVFIVITTQKMLFYFEYHIDASRKSDYFSSFFAYFRDYSLTDLKYQELPGGYPEGEIQIFVKQKSSTSQLLQRQFAWITVAGLFFTEINPANVQESFLKRNQIISYYIDQSLLQRNEEKPPKSVALTEFHCLMMFPNENQIRGVCTVNEKIVMIDGSMSSGRPVCYARDQIRDQLWACTNEHVLSYTIRDERRDVWRVFMQKSDFPRALETCAVIGDPAETARRQHSIHTKHADYLFNEKKYTSSASIYAISDAPFEDVTLKFFALRNKEPLREYLQAVLLQQNPMKDSTQITILTLWLTDLFLNELDELRQAPTSSSSSSSSTSSTLPLGATNLPGGNNRPLPIQQSTSEILDEKSRQEKIDATRRKFQYFLRKPEIKKCLIDHCSAMYDLFTSHGDLDDLIFFAEHVEDHERVILLYIEREDYRKALSTLEPLKDEKLLYKYSPILIEKLPEDLINVWKKKYNDRFELKQLIPAMIAYSRAFPEGKVVLEFLKFCLKRGCTEKSIHNYLLSEYVKFEPKQIEAYLKSQQDCYDPRYALQLCIDHGLKEESVFLYCRLNMLEEAVETALEFDVKLAKVCASTVSNNDELKKKLWLKIARSVITSGGDLSNVMGIIDEGGDDLIKVEDILPLFENFETIDQFKTPIINSLKDYNERLSKLRTEMNDASKSIDEIREDLSKYRTRCVATIDSNEMCSLCEQPLMLQPVFYVFACGHHYHSDCLFTHVRRLMKYRNEHTLEDSQRSFGISSSGSTNEQNKRGSKQRDIDIVNRLQSTIASGIAPPSRDMESVQQELDDLLASHCILCGETAIDCVDQPLDTI